MPSGRKEIEIDWGKVDRYLRAGCTGASVARLMKLHPDTLYNQVKRKFSMDFSAYSTLKKEEGVSLMEYSIYLDAIKRGGADRMFWLKNRAGWKDKNETDLNVNIPQLPDIIIK